MVNEGVPIVNKTTPETDYLAYELINNGKVVEGYTLIYLRQIRDLLFDIRASLEVK